MKNVDLIYWIKDWAIKNENPFDVLNSKLVDDFTNEFGYNIEYKMYGANKCKKLNSLLAWGYKNGYLNRDIISLSGLPNGFPKWVYSYTLNF